MFLEQLKHEIIWFCASIKHCDVSFSAVTMSYNVIISPNIRNWCCLLLLCVNYVIYTILIHRKVSARATGFPHFPLFSQMCLRKYKYKDYKPHFACVIIITQFVIK